MRRMFEDASSVLQSTEISDHYKNTYQFAEGVIELPSGTNYQIGENGIITIYNCPKEIKKGDSFALYINGLPSVYQAKNVTASGGAIRIETTGTESDEMLKQADAQGNAESDLGLAEAVEGTDVTYIVGGTEEASFEDGQMYKSARLAGNQKIKAIKASKTLKLGKGMKVQFNCTLSDVSVDYKIKTLTSNKEVYVSAKGTMEANCNVSVDALQAAGIPSSLDLVYIPVGGVGAITVSMEYAFSGKLSLTYKAAFSEGVQYTSKGGFREVHKFEKKNFTIASEAEVSAGVKASLSITAIPLVKGKVAARVGAKTHFSSDTYNDGKAPKPVLISVPICMPRQKPAFPLRLWTRICGKKILRFSIKRTARFVWYITMKITAAFRCVRGIQANTILPIHQNMGAAGLDMAAAQGQTRMEMWWQSIPTM